MLPSDKAHLTATPKAVEKLSRVRQRQRLVDACISALYQHGPSRTTIDKVVAIADMSPGIVNFYFETKAALLVAALEYLAEEFEDRVLAPLSALRDDPAQALRRLVELYLDPDIASPRKVSVWYAFWGEASSRSEYYGICGKRDEAFADLVRESIQRLIRQSGALHLDADAVALGLIGALEMMWQEIAFHDEAELDRAGARARCLAYLASVFPAQFGGGAADIADHSRAFATPRAAPADASRVDRACAMLVAAELTLAGIPAVVVAEFLPGCDVVAQRHGAAPQKICVRAARMGIAESSIAFTEDDSFDWLAICILHGETGAGRRMLIVPRNAAIGKLQPTREGVFQCGVEECVGLFGAYVGNFLLSLGGVT